jgi:hypothetical protein
MIYVPDWETLGKGSARIIAATGASEGDARIALCHAISDHKIALRTIVAKGEYYAGQPMTGRQLGVPLGLTPAAFDWENSKPIEAWELGRHPDDIDWGSRSIALLEVSTRDLASVFQQSVPIANSAPKNSAKPTRGKVPLVVKQLAIMFPEGVPDPSEAPRKGLIKDLQQKVPALGGSLDDQTLKTAIEQYNNSL